MMNFKDNVMFYLNEQCKFNTVNDETNKKEVRSKASCKTKKAKKACEDDEECCQASRTTETAGGDDDDDGYNTKASIVSDDDGDKDTKDKKDGKPSCKTSLKESIQEMAEVNFF